MKKSNLYLLHMFLLMVLLQSCLKDEVNDITENLKKESLEYLSVPEGFNWDTKQTVNLEVEINYTFNTQFKSILSVYSDDPELGGSQILTASAESGSTFSTAINVPAHLSQLFIKYEDVNGIIEVKPIAIVDNTASVAFGNTTLPESAQKSVSTLWDYTCSSSITENSTSLQIPSDETVCVEQGTTFTGNLKGFRGTLVIKGEVETSTLFIYGGRLIITKTGSLKANNLYVNNSEVSILIERDGILDIKNNWGTKGHLENRGTINLNGAIGLNAGSSIENHGTINIDYARDIIANSNTELTNYGIVKSTSGLYLRSNTTWTNFCTLNLEGDINIDANSSLENTSAYLKAETIRLSSSNATLWVKDASLVECDKLEIKKGGFVKGADFLSTILVSTSMQSVNTSSPSRVDGNIEVACDDYNFYGSEIEAVFVNAAKLIASGEITNVISEDNCSPILKAAIAVDTDGDGVMDKSDAFPEDDQKSTLSYFPKENGVANIAFEDLWPSKGDFDFNDLVMNISGYTASNAENKVTELNLDFSVEAIGASFNNGFGFQFDKLPASSIASVSGCQTNSIQVLENGTEANQNKAVVIISDNVRSMLLDANTEYFNTITNATEGSSETLNIKITFSPAIDPELVDPANLNYFLIKNGDRSCEVHLINRVNTDLADEDLFSTGDDFSSPESETFYQTSNGLPFGLLFLEKFEYPLEQNDIALAYKYIAMWAESGGKTYTDWYSNAAYKNQNKLFHK